MISVVIPAYNEEARIQRTVEAIAKTLSEPYEIIVIDDGSCDRTKEVVRSVTEYPVFLYSHSKNMGKGRAVKTGVEKARGDIICIMDADLPYPPEEIQIARKMIEQGTDVVLGKRWQNHIGAYPFYRKVLSKGFGLFVRRVVHIKERDTQCGFKAFSKKAAKEIFEKATVDGWGFDVEVIFLAEKMHYKKKRLAVKLTHEEKGSKINVLRDIFFMVREVLSIRRKYKKGLYRL